MLQELYEIKIQGKSCLHILSDERSGELRKDEQTEEACCNYPTWGEPVCADPSWLFPIFLLPGYGEEHCVMRVL